MSPHSTIALHSVNKREASATPPSMLRIRRKSGWASENMIVSAIELDNKLASLKRDDGVVEVEVYAFQRSVKRVETWETSNS